MSHNPYAPPTVDNTTPESITGLMARRRDHIVAERRILMAGSTLFTFGFTQLPMLDPLWMLEHLLDSVGSIAVILANLAAAVLLWRLHPAGRWLFLISWGFMDALGIAEVVRGNFPASAVFWLLLIQLLIGLALWRPRARPVFQAEYRNMIVPATPDVRRWSVGFTLFQMLLALVILATTAQLVT